VHADKIPGDLCKTQLPELLPASSGAAHLKRCHLADPAAVYQSEVLPEIAPELVEETR
jgi:peptide/nickel transport system ATP-binding protein